MQAELATDDWLTAFQEAINESSTYHQAGERWDSRLGLAFLADEQHDDNRYVVLELREGRCERAEFVTADEFERSTYRLAGPWTRWQQLANGRLEPLKAIVLKRIEVVGDLLRIAGFLPAAKALLECACSVTKHSDEPAT
ncbi:MAG: SCP2 sterol-binding domain-containing protein [Nitriliruptorales bacterium]|nr:SCP2 sterol-binding domain-containing protein [Nitriliruptorales bacterium]